MRAEDRIRRNRIRRQLQLRRRIALFSAAVLLILSLAGGSFIRIEEGDSLWSIASAHADGFESRQAFMQEVIRINHLLDSDIHKGDYLIIPYYSPEFRQ